VLESALESMSTTFLELSDTMLRAKEVQTSRRLVQKIQNATQRVLDTARDVGEEDGGGEGVDEEPFQKHEDEDEEPVLENLVIPDTEHHPSDLPIRLPSPQPPHQGSSHAWPQSFDDYAMQMQLSPTNPLPYNIPPFTSAFLSHEFWAADYTTYTTFPSPSLPTHLPFPQRLLRISVTTSYHALRGDPGYSTHFTKSQFRFSTPIRPLGFILASARRILTRAEWWDKNSNQPFGPEEVSTRKYFEDEPARIFGLDAKAEMTRMGERVEDFVDAEAVADYLDGKGRFYDDGEVMMMNVRVPDSASLHDLEEKKASKKTLLKLDVNGLIERLTRAAVCMGDMVGYPKAKLNAAIVASVITMAY
jgi:hypothetical protein